MKSECIERSATVTAIEDDQVCLRVLRPSACSGCEASGHCHASESRLEELRLDRSRCPSDIAVGDRVSVELKSGLGMRAVLLTIVLPTLLVVICTLIFDHLGMKPVIQLLSALGIMALYALVLRLSRKYLNKTFVLTARKK